MTLKELIMKVDFDSLLPYLEKWEKKNLDNIYAFREAYDILRNMEPDKDYRGEVTIITTTREDGTKITQVNFLDDNVWEKELAKEFVFPNGMQLNMEELAMRCLWEITFYGFSPVDREDTFSKMFGRRKPLNRYEVALDKLEESMWKHQTPRKFRARDEDGARLTIAHFPFKFCNKPMNRSKKNGNTVKTSAKNILRSWQNGKRSYRCLPFRAAALSVAMWNFCSILRMASGMIIVPLFLEQTDGWTISLSP